MILWKCTANNVTIEILTGLRDRSKRVRTPIALRRSLSDKYPRERYEPPFSPNHGLNSIIAILLQRWLCYEIAHED